MRIIMLAVCLHHFRPLGLPESPQTSEGLICYHIISYHIILYYNLPPFINPPNKQPTLGRGFLSYYKFRRRHDFPPHKIPPLEANIATINLNGGTINLDGGNKVIL